MFRIPGMVSLYIASVVGRLPLGAVSLVLLLRTREVTGSYAAGGAVAAAHGLAMCVASPLLGRLIDRRGQGAVVLVGGLVSAAALCAFAALPERAPTVLAAAVAAVAGAATPPLSSCLRAVLGEAVPAADRHRAFAVDSTLFELIYIAGPLVIVGVVGAWSLEAAAVTCAAATGLGSVAFAATRLSREWRGADRGAGPVDPAGPLRGAGIRTLMATVLLIGLGLAGVEVAVAAFAEAEGHPHAVGVLLALWGVGSMLGGIALARGRAADDLARRLVLLLAALALLQVPLAFAGSLVAMGVAITVAGVAIAPSLATAMQLTTAVAPAGTVTEALTWSTSAIALGLAAGSALAGVVVEAAGTTAALALVVGYGAAAAAVVGARSAALSAA